MRLPTFQGLLLRRMEPIIREDNSTNRTPMAPSTTLLHTCLLVIIVDRPVLSNRCCLFESSEKGLIDMQNALSFMTECLLTGALTWRRGGTHHHFDRFEHHLYSHIRIPSFSNITHLDQAVCATYCLGSYVECADDSYLQG